MFFDRPPAPQGKPCAEPFVLKILPAPALDERHVFLFESFFVLQGHKCGDKYDIDVLPTGQDVQNSEVDEQLNNFVLKKWKATSHIMKKDRAIMLICKAIYEYILERRRKSSQDDTPPAMWQEKDFEQAEIISLD